jgi:hypothetical protein
LLHSICLDSPLFAATTSCRQLTSLLVGGLDLQQDVRAVTGYVPTEDVALGSLRVLRVEQHFNLGPNSAAVLLPELRSLGITHAGSYRWVTTGCRVFTGRGTLHLQAEACADMLLGATAGITWYL